MHAPAQAPDEEQRLAALHALRILDTPPEQRFDTLTAMAKRLFDARFALIGFVDADRYWIKSQQGAELDAIPRELAFCSHTILNPDAPNVIRDTLADPRYADHPLVTGDDAIRFYAGQTLCTLDGQPVGTLCVLDTRPRQVDPDQLRELIEIARWAERKMNARRFRERADLSRPAERRFAALMEALPIGLAVWDAEDQPYFANRAARRYFSRGLQLQPEPTASAALHTLVSHDDTPPTELAVSATRVVDADEQTHYTVALLDDITRLRQSQADLEQTEDTYRELFENASDLVFVCAEDGRLLHTNRTWSEALGVTADDQPSFFDLVHCADRSHARVVFERLKAGEDVGVFKTVLEGPSRERRVVEGHLSCKRVDGVPVAIRGILRDVTRRSRVDHLKNEFISIVHRELRTPITSIRGALGLVAGGLSGPVSPQARALVEVAYRSSERLSRLLSDLLEIEKIELGWTSFDFQDVSLRPLVLQAAEDELSLGAELGVDFHLSSQDDDLRVHADPDRLVLVLCNLLSNAAKFSPDDEPVTIRIERRCWHVRISVTDHGPGVPDELACRIFNKFERGAHQDCGPGIGLSLCKAIVEKHGGSIGFENHHPGVTFFFEIPLVLEDGDCCGGEDDLH